MAMIQTPPSASADQYMRLLKLITTELKEHNGIVLTAGAIAILFDGAFGALSSSQKPEELLSDWESRKTDYTEALLKAAFKNVDMTRALEDQSKIIPLIDDTDMLASCGCLPDGPAG